MFATIVSMHHIALKCSFVHFLHYKTILGVSVWHSSLIILHLIVHEIVRNIAIWTNGFENCTFFNSLPKLVIVDFLWKWILWPRLYRKRGNVIKIWTKISDLRDFWIFGVYLGRHLEFRKMPNYARRVSCKSWFYMSSSIRINDNQLGGYFGGYRKKTWVVAGLLR